MLALLYMACPMPLSSISTLTTSLALSTSVPLLAAENDASSLITPIPPSVPSLSSLQSVCEVPLWGEDTLLNALYVNGVINAMLVYIVIVTALFWGRDTKD